MESSKSIRKIFLIFLSCGGITTLPTMANTPSPHKRLLGYSIEARINEIERELNELKKEKSKTEKNTPQPKLLSTSNDNVKVTLSGWINRAAAYYDNGFNSELKHVDVNAQSSRTTLNGEGKFNDHYKAGFTLQLEYISDSSKFVDIGNGDGSSRFGSQAFSINKRIIEAYMDTWLGRLAFGQGELATNKLVDLDLSGTNMVSEGIELESLAGGIRFATSRGGYTTPAGASANIRFLRVQDAYNEILGVKRFNRVRYDTPKWYGFVLSATHGVRDRSDFALKYAGEFNKTKLVAGIGWFHDPFPGINTFASPQDGGAVSATTYLKSVDQFGGSFSTLFPIGISVGAGYAFQKYKEGIGYEGRKNGHTWGLKLGYQHTYFNAGQTAFAVTYGESYRVMANAPAAGATTAAQRYGGDNSAKAKIWGAYLVQNIDKWGAEVYLAWQTHKLSIRSGMTTTAVAGTNNYNVTVNTLESAAATSNMAFKSINTIAVGTRIKF